MKFIDGIIGTAGFLVALLVVWATSDEVDLYVYSAGLVMTVIVLIVATLTRNEGRK